MYIVVGLGNPGNEYARTRHNVGFDVIDVIGEKQNIRLTKNAMHGLIGEGFAGGEKLVLVKPQTFMNLSGQSVQEAMAFYKIPPQHVIVLFDDISLEPGRIRIRTKGSDGGHNGMKNIIYLAGSQDFPRVKIGVGAKPDPRWDLADWVLSRFSSQEQKKLDEALEHAAGAVTLLLQGNAAEAMNRYNG